MKRDMDLIRLLLLEVEGEEPKPDLSAYSQEQQAYHGALVIEAGLVKGSELTNQEGYPHAAIMVRLTWDGHEFLDAARDEEGWKRATQKVAKAGGAVTLPIFLQILTGYLKHKLGMP